MEDEEAEIIREFLEESAELLDELDLQFVALEEDPTSTERLGAIFRVAHTIKGTAGLLGYHHLERVTHAAENVLAKLRDGEFTLTPKMTSTLLKSVDATRAILAHLESHSHEGDETYDEVIAELTAALAPDESHGAASPEPELVTDEQRVEPPQSSVPPPMDSVPPPEPEDANRAFADGESSLPPAENSPMTGKLNPSFDSIPVPKLAVKPEVMPQIPIPTIAVDEPLGTPSLPPKAPAPETTAAQSKDGDTANRKALEEGVVREANVRVGVSVLDRLMNLVGELVLARNQVLQAAAVSGDAALNSSSQRLSLITTELQEGIMKTRMQAIGSVWTKFPRIVRDLAVVCGKQVRLELMGKDTELDRTVLEAIRDPLTHIVRNSVDHGVETVERRIAVGKPPSGLIVFRAYHEGGMVNIEVRDDGGGIDPRKLREKAISKGLITRERAERLTERESMQLLFLPGFSTAEQVTKVSGRGVGMDVVKTGVEKIGGTVDIQSKLGEGTSILVKIPLTLAIIPALIVACREQRFAIPQVNLIELVRVEGNQAIEYVKDSPVFRLRGDLLPIVFLGAVFGGPPITKSTKCYNIIVLQADSRSFGLVVDDVEDTQEIVVKPLGRELKGIAAFAGATIMGDGRVALILDVFGLANAIGMKSKAGEDTLARTQGELDEYENSESLLAFHLSDGQRMAIPLDAVDRLEEFRLDQIERAGEAKVIQYRNQILRLLDVNDVVGTGRSPSDDDVLQVVVHSREGQTIGLVVDRIVDIVQEKIVIDENVSRRGVLGSAVLHGAVTEILDVNAAWDLLGGY